MIDDKDLVAILFFSPVTLPLLLVTALSFALGE